VTLGLTALALGSPKPRWRWAALSPGGAGLASLALGGSQAHAFT